MVKAATCVASVNQTESTAALTTRGLSMFGTFHTMHRLQRAWGRRLRPLNAGYDWLIRSFRWIRPRNELRAPEDLTAHSDSIRPQMVGQSDANSSVRTAATRSGAVFIGASKGDENSLIADGCLTWAIDWLLWNSLAAILEL